MADQNNFLLYDIPTEAQEHLQQRFAQYPTRGRNSPKQRWIKAQIYISLLDPDISERAYSLWQRGLQIAQTRRAQIDLRDTGEINEKIYKDEEPQLREVVTKFQKQAATRGEVAYRLANILYYLVHIYAQTGGMSEFKSNYLRFCEFAGIPPLAAFSVAQEKMANRAASGKDAQEEMRKIDQILMNFSLSQKFSL